MDKCTCITQDLVVVAVLQGTFKTTIMHCEIYSAQLSILSAKWSLGGCIFLHHITFVSHIILQRYQGVLAL